MGLIKRLQDILAANMGDAVESCENPEPMLKQAIREWRRPSPRPGGRRRGRWPPKSWPATTWPTASGSRPTCNDGPNRRCLPETTPRPARRWPASRSATRFRPPCATRCVRPRRPAGALRGQLDAMQAKLTEAKHRLGTLVARQKSRRRACEIRRPHVPDGSLRQVRPDERKGRPRRGGSRSPGGIAPKPPPRARRTISRRKDPARTWRPNWRS